MWYTIILLSICLAVAVVFWIRADRMAGHYRREALAATDEVKSYRFDGVDWSLLSGERPTPARAERERLEAELTTARRQLAAARGQITKLRKRLGDQ